MKFFLKSTQTLIGSAISSILSLFRRKIVLQFIITRNKPKYQYGFLVLFFTFTFLFLPSTVNAIVDPLSVPNNRFGIHIIQATSDESSPAAQLVNTNGDWGYITVLIESKDRNHEKWQNFFNDLRRRHLIPLVRLATQPDGSFWKRPYEGEEQAWADFLDRLKWPTKNRYIIIYNEPNHAKEWGNKVDAKNYAEVLDKIIIALKNKNRDFFVLNAGFDASAPSQPPVFEDQLIFMKQMNEAVPGIFNKLDGWTSHSYPNPEFAGSPNATGRGTVRTFRWEMQQLKNLGVDKTLPIFIAETGWKHAEGLKIDYNLPSVDIVTQYYQQAFENAWNTSPIVAVTPFLLSYQDSPFDHFSFKKVSGGKQLMQLFNIEDPHPEYYSMFQTIKDLPKVSGQPIQENKAELIKGEVYSSIVAGEAYNISLTFKNSGQSIWNDRAQIQLVPLEGGDRLGISTVGLPKEVKVEPGGEYTFNLGLKAPQSGTYTISLNLFEGDRQFDTPPFKFASEVKTPVILKIVGALGWKKEFDGLYTLKVSGVSGVSAQSISLNKEGISDEIEARFLLPDYTFEFALEKPFYLPASLKQKVHTGVNVLNFGVLKPDIFSAVFNPPQFWRILPFSE